MQATYKDRQMGVRLDFRGVYKDNPDDNRLIRVHRRCEGLKSTLKKFFEVLHFCDNYLGSRCKWGVQTEAFWLR